MKLVYTEEDIQRALNAVAYRVSQVQAGLQYGVPRSTIQDQINGKLPKSEAHQFQQRLSLVQEDCLTQ